MKPDTPTPINSSGGRSIAAGDFNLIEKLARKIKSRRDSSQPAFTEDDSIKRYYGDFSIESKRHTWDLLAKHPKFGRRSDGIQENRIDNNTKDVIGGVTKTDETYY